MNTIRLLAVAAALLLTIPATSHGQDKPRKGFLAALKECQTVTVKASKKIGVSKAEGLPLLAMTVSTLALVHAINPKLAFDGAVKQRLTAAQVRKLDL